jgi:pimeloyl-ACP methyl ester carboxylesterase
LHLATTLVTEHLFVPASDPGITLYLRNKRPADLEAFGPARTVLFVHGANTPAEVSFDLPLGGMSWMDYIARRGYDVYLVDLRGYGRSSRPKEMSEPPDANRPIVRTATAVKDVGAAVDFILARRSLPRLGLIGWSWGTTVMASYTAQHPGCVERLVLYAPQWIRTTPSLISAGPGPLGAYRFVRRDQALARWLTGVPEGRRATLIPPGWFEQWADAAFASDPDGARQIPDTLRAPNGIIADNDEFWSAGRPVYDPGKITVPVLLASPEWDNDTPPYMAQALFSLLVNSPGKRLVPLPEGTHTMLMEANRLSLFEAVQAFLDAGA